MTFMTFYTPTYMRPTYLSICRKSVQAQTCRDFQHMVIVDDAGIGVDGMFRDIRRHADHIRGDYVFILADDDRLLEPIGLEQVRTFAMANLFPPVIIVKNYKWDKTFPLVWEQAPEYAKIDTGNFIIRADVFRDNAGEFGECYEGDWVFIHHLWETGYPFAWCDCIFSTMQVGGKGRTEAEIMKTDKPTRVKALKSFAARINDTIYHINRGQLLEMPAGADWIQAGMVTPIPDAEIIHLAVRKPPEQALSQRGKKRGGK